MTTIWQKIDKHFTQDRKRIKTEVRKELIHTRLEEQFRGKDWVEKIKGVIKILLA